MLGMPIGGGNKDLDNQSFLTTPTSIGDPQTVSQGTQHIGDERANPETAGSNMSRRRLMQ
jgi:hypothetical protein